MVNFSSTISGLKAAMLSSNVTANNLANVNTAGFKGSRAVHMSAQGTLGVSQSAVQTNLSQGSITVSGSSLDLAISGNGYFSVDTPNGTAYTRNGSFQINNQNILTDTSGNPLSPQIQVPGNSTSISINGQGSVTAMVNGQPQQIGQLNLTTFANPNGLESLGNSLYGETVASGQPMNGSPETGGRGSIVPGGLEESNVDIADGMVNLIIDKNAFKANTKLVKVQDEMTKNALDIIA